MAADAVRGTRRSTGTRSDLRNRLKVRDCSRVRCYCNSVVRLACGCENHMGGEMYHCLLHASAQTMAALLRRIVNEHASPATVEARALLARLDNAPAERC